MEIERGRWGDGEMGREGERSPTVGQDCALSRNPGSETCTRAGVAGARSSARGGLAPQTRLKDNNSEGIACMAQCLTYRGTCSTGTCSRVGIQRAPLRRAMLGEGKTGRAVASEVRSSCISAFELSSSLASPSASAGSSCMDGVRTHAAQKLAGWLRLASLLEFPGPELPGVS